MLLVAGPARVVGLVELAPESSQGATVTLVEIPRLAEAVEAVARHAFDAVVHGIVTAHGGGIELARELREADPDLPVVVMSGHSEEQVSPDDLAAEGIRYLGEPFGAGTLASVVRDALGPIRPG